MNNDSNLSEAYDFDNAKHPNTLAEYRSTQQALKLVDEECFDDEPDEIIFAYEYLPAYA